MKRFTVCFSYQRGDKWHRDLSIGPTCTSRTFQVLQMQVAFNNLSICGEWGTAASTRIPHPRRSLYLPCAM